MKNRLKTLDYNGTGIVFTADGWLNATASAAALNKPNLDNFLGSKAYTEYAEVVAAANSVKSTELKRTKQGNGGGTFLHPEMAVAFARWISPAFAYWCDKQVATLIRLAQEAPARNERLRTRRMERLGATPDAIAKRNEGVPIRAAFTNRLQKSGCNPEGFRGCTRAIYQPMFGGGTDEIKKKYDLPPNANVRDYMSPVQLLAVGLAEALSTERIEKQGDWGNMACEHTCNIVGKEVAKVIVGARNLPS
jgi:hypothetical protein